MSAGNSIQAISNTSIDMAAFLPPAAPAGKAGNKPRMRSVYFLGFLLVCGLAGVGVGMLLGQAEKSGMTPSLFGASLEDALPRLSGLVVLVSALLGFWPNVIVHEAGHALCGMARGMRAISIGIGRLRWERGQSGWRFRRSGPARGMSGFVALLPQGNRGLSRLDQMLYLAGGPLANLLTAALCAALFSLVAESRVATSMLVGVGANALLLGVINLVPFHSKGWRSDGRGLLDLLLRRPDASLQQQLQQVMALNMAGVRPRDWPAALVPAPSMASSSPMLAISGDMLRLSHAIDCGNTAVANECALALGPRLHTAAEAFQPHVAVTLAGHAALVLRDRNVLAAWRPLCEGGLLDLSLLRAWLYAELLALSGERADAIAAIAEARSLLDRAPDPVTALLIGEYLQALDARLAVGRPDGDRRLSVKDA